MLNQHDDMRQPAAEEWVLYGILGSEYHKWLERANAHLLLASEDTMHYALAPLSLMDFVDPSARQMFDLILKADTPLLKTFVSQHMDEPLKPFYRRLVVLQEIGKEFLMPFDYDIFVHYVCEVRITRLDKEYVTFKGKDPAKARECARAIACLRLAQSDLIDKLP